MTPAEWKALAAKTLAEDQAHAAALAAGAPAYLEPKKAAVPDKAHPTASPEFKQAARNEGNDLEDQKKSLGTNKEEADKEGKDLRAKREEERLDTPVSFGGARQPSFMETLARIADDPTGLPAQLGDYLPDGEVGDILRSLLPQAADTPAQADDRKARMDAAESARQEAANAVAMRLANDKQGAVSSEELESARRPAHIDATEYAPAIPARSDAQVALIERYPDLAESIDANNKAIGEEEKIDRASDAARGHESVAAYGLRLLGAPTSAAAGVLEGTFTGETIGEAVAKRIRGGEGFTGSGVDAGRSVGTSVGNAVEEATGLPLAAPIRRLATLTGGLGGFAADLAVPVDLGISDLVTGGRAARAALEGVPRELAPSLLERAVTSVIPGAESTPQTRSLAELRNRVGGIPSVYQFEAKALAKDTRAPIADAAAFTLAKGLAEGQTSPGEAVVYRISQALGGDTDVVTAAGVAEGQAARARMLADRAVTTERAGTAARSAEAELAELRRLEAEDLDLARSLRESGQVEQAARLEKRVAESSRVATAEQAAAFKAANLEKYKAQRAEVSRLRQEEAARLEAAATAARAKADTYQQYAQTADALLAEGPKKGTGAKIDKLVEDVRALLAPKAQVAAGDATRVVSHAYLQAKTWDIVADVVSKSADPVMAGVRAEVELGPEKFFEALKAQAPQLAKSMEKASQIGDNSALGKLLNDRAAVARKLDEYNQVTAGAPLRTRKAWAWLQQTAGYGVPLIDDLGRPMIANAVGAGVRKAKSVSMGAMKAGMLSGYAAANPKFHINNFLTGPSIVMSTLGPRMAVASLLSFDSVTVLRALEGNAAARAREIAPGWTGEAIARLVAENGITRSQAAEELGSKGIEALVEFGQRASDNRLTSHLKSLGGYGNNMWAELANLSDGFFRINVLTRALKDGRSPEEAVILARESLFDYGNLTDFERSQLGKYVWFWAFRRNNYRAMMRNVLSNPARLSSLAAINNAMSEPTPDNGATTYLATQHYAENAPMWRMISDEASQSRYSLNGPPLPAIQAFEDGVDAMRVLALMAEDHSRRAGMHGALAAGDRLRDDLLQSTNPLAAAGISILFGINVQHGAEAGLSGTLDPRIAWYLQQTPGMWEWAVSTFDLVEVQDSDKVKSGGNFLPSAKSAKGTGQWKIGSDSGKRQWALMMLALQATGEERAMREGAPWLAAVADALGEDRASVAPNLGNAPGTSPWDRLGIMAGVLSAVNQPPVEQTVERNAQVREREVIPSR